MSTEAKPKRLDTLLYTDELTKIYNRRYLKEVIPGHLVRAEEEGFSVALYMIDMDKFKNINDTYGHGVGDNALQLFSKIISLESKERGDAIRYAGDEFVLVLSELDKKGARQIGLDIQKKLTDTPLKAKEDEVILGCSMGISLFPKDGKTVKVLFEKADEALYVAKDRGRGTVVVFPDSGKLLVPSKLDSILDTPYVVGRDDVLQFMDTHLSKKGKSTAFPVLLGGDGAGKTRLLAYARKRAEKKLDFTLFARGYPLWQTEVYGAVFSALGRLFEQDTSISNQVFTELEDKYKTILKPYLHPWEMKEVETTEEDPRADSTTYFEALTQVFLILRQMGDGAVILDDIDQIDQPSLQFFDSQTSQEKGGKLFFICAINSPDLLTGEEKLLFVFDSMPEMASRCTVQRFHLDPLKQENIKELTEKLFDGKTLPAESEKSLFDKSGGRPLFIVEALSLLLMKGKIEVVGDEWDLSLVKPEDIPTNLTEMLKERLLKMDKEAINVLKLASILGEKINTRQLAEMCQLNVPQVLDILVNAQRALLIEESPNPDEFTFSHRLDRSVFYSLMSEEERRKYHSVAADIEQKFAPGALERVVGKLAYHFQSAGQLEQASQMFSTLRKQMSSVSISRGARKILQKKTLTSSLARESELEEEDLAIAVDLARAFRTAIHNFRLYPKEHENVKNSVARFIELLGPFLAEKTEVLSVSVTPQSVLFNGLPPPPTKDDKKLTADLNDVLGLFGLQGVLFLGGITEEEIMRFFDAFTRHPEDVMGQWDVLVNELDLAHILPDRKVFVAVSEHKVTLQKDDLLAQAPASPGEKASGPGVAGVVLPGDAGLSVSDEQLDQLKSILDQFVKEKQELLEAIQSEDIGKAEFKQLVNILQHTDIARAEEAVRASEAAPASADAAPPGEGEAAAAPKGKYAGVLADEEIVVETEKDLYPAFEDLNSEDTQTRAKAASWLVKQDPIKLAGAALLAIASNMPLKARKLAATVVQKSGEEAMEAFLDKINPEAPVIPLPNFITVADIFIASPKLVQILRKIALTGPTETIRPTIEILDKVPGGEINMILLEVFNLAAGEVKRDILNMFAKRRMTEAVPLLLDIIKPKKTWEKEGRISLQERVCRTLGQIGSSEAADILVAVATVPKPFTFLKQKPDSVREAATWALRQLPDRVKIRRAIQALKNDKSPNVRKAARQ
ncbi:MAG: diguanylate cyclase [Candidatus Aminicenantes bacterium]|jgi:diguanylate cyclase (GGDEF)-like protein